MAKKVESVLDQIPENSAKPAVAERRPVVAAVSSASAPSVESGGGSVHRPGDACVQVIGKRKCVGVLSVTSTYVDSDGRRVRYLQCSACHKPNPQYKQIIPSKYGSRGRRNAS